jgi:hypothetical protein
LENIDAAEEFGEINGGLRGDLCHLVHLFTGKIIDLEGIRFFITLLKIKGYEGGSRVRVKTYDLGNRLRAHGWSSPVLALYLD